jgi:IS5 family transposase
VSGAPQADGTLLSVLETHTEVIRNGKANKSNEFGKLVPIQEVENQIITHDQVYEQRPAGSTLLEGCLEANSSDAPPERVAADAGFFSAANEGSLDRALHHRHSPDGHQRGSMPWKDHGHE